jgi:toluene monooxygenase system ferredoxin subunit
MARTAVCKTGDVPPNSIRQFDKICVINAGERFFACQAYCPHQGVALCEGALDGETLTCLEHLWRWNLGAGGEPEGLAEKALQMHSIEIEGDVVYVDTPA